MRFHRRFILSGMSSLAPWVALQRRAVLLLTNDAGDNVATYFLDRNVEEGRGGLSPMAIDGSITRPPHRSRTKGTLPLVRSWPTSLSICSISRWRALANVLERRAQKIAIGLTGDPVALGSANGLTVNMNSQRLREAAASLNASKSARSSTWIPRIAWMKL